MQFWASLSSFWHLIQPNYLKKMIAILLKAQKWHLWPLKTIHEWTKTKQKKQWKEQRFMICTAGNKEVCQGWVETNAIEENKHALDHNSVQMWFSPPPAVSASPPPSCECPPWWAPPSCQSNRRADGGSWWRFSSLAANADEKTVCYCKINISKLIQIWEASLELWWSLTSQPAQHTVRLLI